MPFLRLLGRVSLPYARRHLGLTLLTAAGVSLGVAVFVAVQIASASLKIALRQTLDRVAGKAQLQVTSGEVGFPEEVLDAVRAVPGVRAAAPVVEAVVRSEKASEGNILVLGVDLTGDRLLRDYEFEGEDEAIEDPLVFLAQPDSICLSADFAARNGLAEGDAMAFETALGPKEFTVRGLLAPKGFATAFGGNLAVMDVYAAQFVFNRGRRFDRIDVLLEPGVPLESAHGRLAAALGPGLTVEPPFRRGAEMESLLDAFGASMNLSCWQALVIGIFLIFNVFAVAVTRRRFEIGVLRSLGAGPRRIRALFLAEAALLGLAGTAAGVPLGLLLARGAAGFMHALVVSAYGLSHVTSGVSWSWGPVVLGASLGLAASLGATWFPAGAAARVDPVEALSRGGAQRFTARQSRARLWAGVLTLGAAGAIRWHAGNARQIAWSLAALAALGAASILLAPHLAAAACRLLRPVMARLGGVEGRLAVDAMLAAPRRTSATVAALMLSVAFGIAQAGFAASFETSFSRYLGDVISADFYVTGTERFISKAFQFPADYGGEMERIEGVRHVERVRVLRHGFEGRQIIVLALEMEKFFSRATPWVTRGSEERMREEVAAGRAVSISDNFSVLCGLDVGDVLTLDTPSGPLSLPIAAVLVDYSSDKGTVFLDRSVYVRWWRDDSVDTFDLMLAPGADPGAVKGRVLEAFAGRGTRLFVFTGAEFRANIARVGDQFFALTYVQFAIALVVAVMGIVNSLLISVAERRREIGVLKAIGAARGQVRRLVVFEAVSIVLAGSALGFAVGAALLEVGVDVVGPVIHGWILPYVYPAGVAAAALPTLIAVAAAAAWYPARVALGTTAVEALAYE